MRSIIALIWISFKKCTIKLCFYWKYDKILFIIFLCKIISSSLLYFSSAVLIGVRKLTNDVIELSKNHFEKAELMKTNKKGSSTKMNENYIYIYTLVYAKKNMQVEAHLYWWQNNSDWNAMLLSWEQKMKEETENNLLHEHSLWK